MRARKYAAVVILVLGVGVFALAAYGWHVLDDAGSSLEQSGAFQNPNFPAKSLDEWKAAVWVRLGLWIALGVLFLMAGAGLLAAATTKWGWQLSVLSAVLLLVLYAIVLVVRPSLWDEFLAALGVSLGVLSFYRESRKLKDAF